MDKKLSELDPSRNELSAFLIGTLQGRLTDCENLSLSQLKMETTNLIADLDLKLGDARFELGKERSSRADFEHEVAEFLERVQQRLIAITESSPMSSDGLTIPELCRNIRGLLDEGQRAKANRLLFKRFLSSFLSQITFAFRLPVSKTLDMADDELQNVMLSIVNAPRVQRRLGSFTAQQQTEDEQDEEEKQP
jgi:hypothetical protein